LKKIRLAVSGLGNCASSLIQGIEYYKSVDEANSVGLMHYDIGGYRPGDIEIAAAFDIDARKVGLDVSEAIFSRPNCTKVFYPDVPSTGVTVKMGPVLDGIAPHMKEYPEDNTFLLSNESPCNVVRELSDSGADILINYMPVGSEEATRFYAQAALDAEIAFINCMPVFIASNEAWARKFSERGVPVVGDEYQVPDRRDNRPQGLDPALPVPRMQAGQDVPAQRRWKHRLSQYAIKGPSQIKEDLEDGGGPVCT